MENNYSFCDVSEIAKLPTIIYVCVTFLQMLSILCDSMVEYVQAFDECVVHVFPGTTINQLTFKLKRQPNLV